VRHNVLFTHLGFRLELLLGWNMEKLTASTINSNRLQLMEYRNDVLRDQLTVNYRSSVRLSVRLTLIKSKVNLTVTVSNIHQSLAITM
jgi:hypothetical protein